MTVSTSKPLLPGENLGQSAVSVSEVHTLFTFDDGPHVTLTPKVLEILKEENTTATLVGFSIDHPFGIVGWLMEW